MKISPRMLGFAVIGGVLALAPLADISLAASTSGGGGGAGGGQSPQYVRIIDNGDRGFTTNKGWVGPYMGQGYQNDVHFTSKGNGSRKATWTFENLPSGRYQVAATWSSYTNRATNAPYRIVAESTPGDFVRVNQQKPVADFSANDASWQHLGMVEIRQNGAIRVILSNDANGFVIADAIRIERVQVDVCGNGIKEASEQCDDGNSAEGDGCSAQCTIERPQRQLGDVDGDGILSEVDAVLVRQHVQGTRILDTTDLPYADADGNGQIQQADSFLILGSANASGSVQLPAVYGDATGNGGLSSLDTSYVSRFIVGLLTPTLQQRYLSDADANGILDDRDVQLVSRAVVGLIDLPVLCGNGLVEQEWGEQCDDGNTMNGDGCSAQCTIESIVRGNLYVHEYNVPRSRQLLAGTLGDSVLQINMRAQHEDIRIDTIRIAASGATAGDIAYLELYRANETTKFATATPCNSAALPYAPLAFCVNLNASQFVVGENESMTVTVRPRLNNDEMGAQSRQEVAFWMEKGSIVATGLQSAMTLMDNDNDDTAEGEIFLGRSLPGPDNPIFSSIHAIVLAKFSAITNKLPVRPLPVGNDQEIARFEFSAANNNNTANGGRNAAILSDVTFTVATVNVAIDPASFHWYRTSDPSVKASCFATMPANNGTFQVACSGNGAMDIAVNSGESASFSLEADIMNNAVLPSQQSRLQVSLTNFTDRSQGSASHVRWTDEEATYLWIDYPETTIFSTLLGEIVTPEPVCGNGIPEAGEQCDDGDMDSGDGCSAQCRTECTHAQFQGATNGLECTKNGCYYDELAATESTTGTCAAERPSCLDESDKQNDPFVKGRVWALASHAYDARGRIAAYDYCQGNTLRQVSCGADAFVAHTAMTCTHGCSDGVCLPPPPALQPVCGNNVEEGNEQCDDGNTENGDGCSAQCTAEEEEYIPVISLVSVEINDGNVTVMYGKNFPTCGHLRTLQHQLVHTQNIFCSNGDGIIVTQPLSQVQVTPGQTLQLCHGNNGNVCSSLVTVTGQ